MERERGLYKLPINRLCGRYVCHHHYHSHHQRRHFGSRSSAPSGHESHEGYEGDEEESSNEAPRHEGSCCASGHEGHEGHEGEGHGGYESHARDEEEGSEEDRKGSLCQVLTKSDLAKNKRGKIVSKKQSAVHAANYRTGGYCVLVHNSVLGGGKGFRGDGGVGCSGGRVAKCR